MSTNPEAIRALRTHLKSQGLDGFVVPLTDEHMSEYVGGYAERLGWLTGFGGSAGNAVVLADTAAIFIDGRYTIQVTEQVDANIFEQHHFQEYPLLKWVADKAPKGARIGFDPELATVGWVEAAEATLGKKGIELVTVGDNPIDAVWEDRPTEPLSMVKIHDDKYAGKSSEEKRQAIAKDLHEEGLDAAVITMLDSVAWLLNIRAEDVPNTPVPHAFAVVRSDASATLFVNNQKITPDVQVALGNSVSVEPREHFYDHLKELGEKGQAVLVDRASNNAKVFHALNNAGAKLVEGEDPCILAKAVKNAVEQQGARDAHIRDGAAIVEFLHWIATEAPKGTVDELSAVDKLWSIRESRDLIQDRSFDTISGAGPNGASPHYRVDAASNRKLELNSLYLVDSGGQYLDGTTDITRTMAIGTPTQEMRENYTRVLQGHIALSLTKFPKGTSGAALDAIARKPLWDAGLDYDHGTGHGVGSYLAVHEGPQRIAKGSSDVPLQPGMILSNEPGYYKTGEYGIRIENLVLVRPVAGVHEREMYEFENLTFAPLDPTLIVTEMLSDTERDWVNNYHAEVAAKIGPLVEGEAKDWLSEVTAKL